MIDSVSSKLDDIISLSRRRDLSKRLKRRIKELCGFDKLSREQRLIRANEILKSAELKQAICHEILGISHKDVEKVMLSIINERQVTEKQEEILSLAETVPEKFDYEFEFNINRSTSKKKEPYRTYTMEEVQRLLEASKEPIRSSEPPQRIKYPMMPRELVEKLVEEYLQYKKEQNLKLSADKTKTSKTFRPSNKPNPTKD